MENRDKARSAVEPAEALGTTDEVDETSKS